PPAPSPSISPHTPAAAASLSHQTLAVPAAAAALSVVGEEPRWQYSPPISLSLSCSTSQAWHTGATSAGPTHGRHTELQRDGNLAARVTGTRSSDVGKAPSPARRPGLGGA
ncbi:unnamed protein product, partial [Urochloa humidicola]